MFDKFDMARGAKIYMADCYQVKPGMEVLIMTDTSSMIEYGEIFARAVHEAGGEAVVTVMSPMMCDGEEPPRSIAKAMKGPNGPDLVVTMCKQVFLHSKAGGEAMASGTHVMLPPINAGRVELIGQFNTTIEDLKVMAETKKKIVEFFKDKDQVHITSASGTDLTLSVKGRPWSRVYPLSDTPLFKEKGWEAFPKDMKLPDLLGYGETPCSPVQGSANGVYAVDATMCGIGVVDQPIIWKIRDGSIVEISGGKAAEKLKSFIRGDVYAINIGEFSLGINHIISKTPRGDHMDKSILGGMHLGMGSSTGDALKGGVQAQLHEDGISLNMTIEADGKPLMKDGKLLI